MSTNSTNLDDAWDDDPGNLLLNTIMLAVAATSVDLDSDTYGLPFLLAYRQRVDSLIEHEMIPKRYTKLVQETPALLEHHAQEWYRRIYDTTPEESS